MKSTITIMIMKSMITRTMTIMTTKVTTMAIMLTNMTPISSEPISEALSRHAMRPMTA